MIKEFKAFIMRGNVVDLAVAVVIGAAFGAVITAFVDNLLTPLIGIIGQKDFTEFDFTIRGSKFRYGLFVNAFVAFLFVAAAIFFFVVKPINWMNERRRRGEVEPEDIPAPSDEALLLAEIRDLLKAETSRTETTP